MKKKIKYTNEPVEFGPRADDLLPSPEWFKLKRQRGVKVIYSEGEDVLRLQLSDEKVSESDESMPGVILDYDAQGHIIGGELLDASKRSRNPRSIEFTVND